MSGLARARGSASAQREAAAAAPAQELQQSRGETARMLRHGVTSGRLRNASLVTVAIISSRKSPPLSENASRPARASTFDVGGAQAERVPEPLRGHAIADL